MQKAKTRRKGKGNAKTQRHWQGKKVNQGKKAKARQKGKSEANRQDKAKGQWQGKMAKKVMQREVGGGKRQ